ncbi:MAG: hypothetical protein IPG19_07385 [Burkholderiales bacterium]|nr:hypothetical protein [Burkholderiales bacterium]
MDSRYTGLGTYRFTILERFRQQLHVLDELGERLLSLATRFNQTPAAVSGTLTSDIGFPKKFGPVG